MSEKKIIDEELEQVSGGFCEVNNTLYDPRTTKVNGQNAIMDDNTKVVCRFVAGAEQQTGGQQNPLNTKKPVESFDPFGSELNAGSGLA